MKAKERLHQAEEENKRLRNQLREANIEIRRMNRIVLEAKDKAKLGALELQQLVSMVYISVAERFGSTKEDGTVEMEIPGIQWDAEKAKRLSFHMDAETNKIMVTLTPEVKRNV